MEDLESRAKVNAIVWEGEGRRGKRDKLDALVTGEVVVHILPLGEVGADGAFGAEESGELGGDLAIRPAKVEVDGRRVSFRKESDESPRPVSCAERVILFSWKSVILFSQEGELSGEVKRENVR